jgi:uncharacterized membrane protein
VSFHGPLPPPAFLEHYARIIPGSPERILAMAEQQSRHRREIEALVVHANIASERRGQAQAFTLGLLTIVGGIGLMAGGLRIEGFVSLIVAVGGILGLFIAGRVAQGRERARKRSNDGRTEPGA